MPFTKGHKLSIGNKGGGRKGYEFEKEYMERMKKVLDQYLTLIERDVLAREEQNRLKMMERFVLKILDKMFANKLAVKEETDRPLLIIDEAPKLPPKLVEKINKIYGNKDKDIYK